MILFRFKLYTILLFLILFSQLTFLPESLAQDHTYKNPLENLYDVGDPSVLKWNGKYYLYGTSFPEHGYKVWESEDMVHWIYRGIAFDNRITGNEWGQKDFWAPEVIYYNGKFYMVYSARASDGKLKIALASSTDPLGPFTNIRAPLFDFGFSTIDAHLFVDDDGSVYLFYVKDVSDNIIDGKHISQIFVMRLQKYYLSPAGDPVLAIQPSQEWEGINENWQWNEGPFVIKNNGIYYLMYSANPFWDPNYGVGYATANNPLGPWTKFDGNPVLSKNLNIGVSGPGHNCVTVSPDGKEKFVFYHTHKDPDNPYAGRSMNMDRLIFRGDTLVILGPTRSPQPMPSGSCVVKIKGYSPFVPNSPRLFQNFPNPFNSETYIEFEIPSSGFVKLSIFDPLGRTVRNLIRDNQQTGIHFVRWDGKDENGREVSSGIYIYTLYFLNRTLTKRMILSK